MAGKKDAYSEILATLPASAFSEEIVTRALSIGILTPAEIVAIELRRLEAGLDLTAREIDTALRLRDDLESVREDWFSEPPQNFRAMFDDATPHAARVLLILLTSVYTERNHVSEQYIWDLETLFSQFDTNGLFEKDRFFAPNWADRRPRRDPTDDRPYKLVIQQAVVREARRLADEED